MRFVFKSFLAATLVVAFAASADAQGQRRGGTSGAGGQPPGGGRGQGGGMFGGGAGVTQLVTNKSVQEELKVTDEQKEKLTTWSRDAGAKLREKMGELFTPGERPDPAKTQEIMAKISAEQMDEVGKVLKDDQTKRLKQIMLQIQGIAAFRTKPVEEALKLTDDQKSTIKEIADAMQAERREAFAGGAGGGGGAGGRGRGQVDPAALAEMQKKTAEMNKKYMEKVSAQLKDEQKKAWDDMTGKAFDYKPEAPRRRDN